MQKNSLPRRFVFTMFISAILAGNIFSLPFEALADEYPNPIINPSLETADPNDATLPDRWNQGFWGASTAVFAYPVISADGTKAAKVEITDYADGDAKWFFRDVAVNAGERYIFSDQYLANVTADIVVRYAFPHGEYRYIYLGTSIISTEWTGYETHPFMVPEGAVSLTVFHLIHETGSLSIDNISLRRLAPEQELTEAPASGSGGVVPLSYITLTGTRAAPSLLPLPAALPESPRGISKEPSLFHAVSETVNGMTSFTRAHTAEAADQSLISPSDISQQQETADSLANSLAANPLNGLSNSTLVFLGLSLVLVSMGIPALASYHNTNASEKEDPLWEP